MDCKKIFIGDDAIEICKSDLIEFEYSGPIWTNGKYPCSVDRFKGIIAAFTDRNIVVFMPRGEYVTEIFTFLWGGIFLISVKKRDYLEEQAEMVYFSFLSRKEIILRNRQKGR